MKDFITAIALAFSPVKVMVNKSLNLKTTIKYKRVFGTTVVVDIDYEVIDSDKVFVVPDIDYLKLKIEGRSK